MASRRKQCEDPCCPCDAHGGHARHLEYSDEFEFEPRLEPPRSKLIHKGGLGHAERARLSAGFVSIALATRNSGRVNPPPRGTKD